MKDSEKRVHPWVHWKSGRTHRKLIIGLLILVQCIVIFKLLCIVADYVK